MFNYGSYQIKCFVKSLNDPDLQCFHKFIVTCSFSDIFHEVEKRYSEFVDLNLKVTIESVNLL